MKLYEFTTMTSEDKKQVVHVSARIADQSDPELQKEYITFQFAIDASIAQNGATLRQAALLKANEILRELALDFGTIGNQFY